MAPRNYTHIYANSNDDPNNIQYATENAIVRETVALTQSPNFLPQVNSKQHDLTSCIKNYACLKKTKMK